LWRFQPLRLDHGVMRKFFFANCFDIEILAQLTSARR
jgi:hypothetical protein